MWPAIGLIVQDFAGRSLEQLIADLREILEMPVLGEALQPVPVLAEALQPLPVLAAVVQPLPEGASAT